MEKGRGSAMKAKMWLVVVVVAAVIAMLPLPAIAAGVKSVS